jgi:hypothetical protein
MVHINIMVLLTDMTFGRHHRLLWHNRRPFPPSIILLHGLPHLVEVAVVLFPDQGQ